MKSSGTYVVWLQIAASMKTGNVKPEGIQNRGMSARPMKVGI